MDNKNEFKPYIPAEKVTPEITVTSIVMGIILAVVFGAAMYVVDFVGVLSYGWSRTVSAETVFAGSCICIGAMDLHDAGIFVLCSQYGELFFLVRITQYHYGFDAMAMAYRSCADHGWYL